MRLPALLFATTLAIASATGASPYDYRYGSMGYYNEQARESSFDRYMNSGTLNASSTPDFSSVIDTIRNMGKSNRPTPRQQQEPADTDGNPMLRYFNRHRDEFVAPPVDTRTPFEKLNDAAKAGQVVAMWNLAHNYLRGAQGAPQNPQQGIYWLEQAAGHGHVESMSWCYYLLIDGKQGVAANKEKAYSWLKAAAEAGHAESQEQLAEALLEGRDLKADAVGAREWLKQSAARNWPTGVTLYSRALRSGAGGPVDRLAGLEVLRVSLKQEPNAYVAEELSRALLEDPKDAAAHRDEVFAGLRTSDIRTDLRYLEAQLLDSNRIGPRDPAGAVAVYEKVAKLDSNYFGQQSMVALGQHYASGDGVVRDYTRAAFWFQKGLETDKENANAKIGLAYLLRDGHGVEADSQRAYDLFSQVATSPDIDRKNKGQAGLEAGVLFVLQPSLKYTAANAPDKCLELAAEVDAGAYLWRAILAERGLMGKADLKMAIDFAQRGADRGDEPCMNQVALWMWQDDERHEREPDATSLYYVRKAAEAGYPRAIGTLGLAYLNGSGIDKDVPKAVELINKAIGLKDPYSMAIMAQMKGKGVGVPKDIPGAARLLRTAAPDDLDARVTLGLGLTRGEFGETDPVEGARLVREVADAGDWIAALAFARLSHIGLGVPQDDITAARYMQLAGTNGNMDKAWETVGKAFLSGQQVKRDPVEAARWMLKAAEVGDIWVMADLSRLYRTGAGGSVDYAAAYKWAQLGSQGDSQAGVELGILQLKGLGTPKDSAAGLKTIEKNCAELASVELPVRPEAFEILAQCYEQGIGTAKDAKKAALYRKDPMKALSEYIQANPDF